LKLTMGESAPQPPDQMWPIRSFGPANSWDKPTLLWGGNSHTNECTHYTTGWNTCIEVTCTLYWPATPPGINQPCYEEEIPIQTSVLYNGLKYLHWGHLHSPLASQPCSGVEIPK
jgi:hypothetical protein